MSFRKEKSSNFTDHRCSFLASRNRARNINYVLLISPCDVKQQTHSNLSRNLRQCLSSWCGSVFFAVNEIINSALSGFSKREKPNQITIDLSGATKKAFFLTWEN